MKEKYLIISVLLIVPLIALCKYRESYYVKITNLEERIDSLKSENDRLKNLIHAGHAEFLEYKKQSTLGSVIDLYSKSMQKIGEGFFIVGLETSTGLTGLKLSGRVINSTSLKHENIRFKMTIGNESGELHVPMVSAGNSTEFKTDIPGASKDAKTAVVRYVSSSVQFCK